MPMFGIAEVTDRHHNLLSTPFSKRLLYCTIMFAFYLVIVFENIYEYEQLCLELELGFLADRTNGRAIATLLHLSSSVCDVMYCG